MSAKPTSSPASKGGKKKKKKSKNLLAGISLDTILDATQPEAPIAPTAPTAPPTVPAARPEVKAKRKGQRSSIVSASSVASSVASSAATATSTATTTPATEPTPTSNLNFPFLPATLDVSILKRDYQNRTPLTHTKQYSIAFPKGQIIPRNRKMWEQKVREYQKTFQDNYLSMREKTDEPDLFSLLNKDLMDMIRLNTSEASATTTEPQQQPEDRMDQLQQTIKSSLVHSLMLVEMLEGICNTFRSQVAQAAFLLPAVLPSAHDAAKALSEASYQKHQESIASSLSDKELLVEQGIFDVVEPGSEAKRNIGRYSLVHTAVKEMCPTANDILEMKERKLIDGMQCQALLMTPIILRPYEKLTQRQFHAALHKEGIEPEVVREFFDEQIGEMRINLTKLV